RQIRRQRRRDDLDRGALADHRMDRRIDLAHAARADAAFDPELAHALSGRERRQVEPIERHAIVAAGRQDFPPRPGAPDARRHASILPESGPGYRQSGVIPKKRRMMSVAPWPRVNVSPGQYWLLAHPQSIESAYMLSTYL